MAKDPAIVNWGILSTAEIAHKVVKAMHAAKNGRVAAVASRELSKATAWAKSHDVPVAYGTYEELLADTSLDAIYIPLPTSLKTGWAMKAVAAGKHVLVEKPLPGTADTSEVEALIHACRERNLQFMDGTMWLHSTRTAQLEQLLASGKLGDLRRVIAAFTISAPDPEWLNGGNGRTDKSREPMGCFGDQGWYPIGAILWAYRYELPLKVRMDSWTMNKVDTIVACSGTLWFADGKTATFDTGANAAHRAQFEVVGSQGCLRVEDQVGGQGRSGDFNAYFDAFTGSSYFKLDDQQGKETVVNVEPCDHTARMIEDFSDLVLRRQPADTWPQRSLAMHKVMVALMKSWAADGALIPVAAPASK